MAFKTKSALCTILAAFLVACSTVPQDNFRRIEITADDWEAIVEDSHSKGKSAAAGAAIGATGGLLYSALLSLACGPFFAACFAGTAPVAVGASAVGLGVAGAVSTPREDLEDLKEFMGPVLDSVDLNQELAAAVAELLPPEKIAETGNADARLSLGIESLKVNKSWGSVNLHVRARARFDWKLDQDNPRHAERFYAGTAGEDAPEDWPENSNELTRMVLDRCIRDFAGQIHGALTEPPDSDPAGFAEWPD